MKVLLTGAGGQLGRALQASRPDDIELLALSSQALDIRQAGAIEQVVEQAGPALIINAAAYTAVDKAEQERALAYAVNAEGPGHLAAAASRCGARLIHVSTDFVFNGEQSHPYAPSDKPDPVSVYGASKLAGEQRVLQTCPSALIFRTAWVYARYGRNFVKTMLRLMDEKDQLGIVADQVGTPTWATTLANVIWQAANQTDMNGVYHCTDAGVASWYDFATAIQEEALARGLLKKAIPLRPIATRDYPTPAKRPAYSVLDSRATWARLDETPSHWRHALRCMLDEWVTE